MLEEIEIFCAVAKHRGFAKAARLLHLSPSIITRRIIGLEQKLDAILLHRTTRQVTLTEAGKLYYDEMNPILEQINQANKKVKSLENEVAGTLKVGLPTSISHLLNQYLHEFLARYPAVKIEIMHGNHLFDLLENNFDLILHCGELPDSNFYYKKIGLWHKVICASPEYLQKHGTPQTPADLIQHNCLDHADNFRLNWKFQIQDQIQEINVSGNIRINSSMDLVILTANHLGISYLPSFVVAPYIKSKRLTSILESYRPPALGMYLVYPNNKYLSQKVKVFIKFMTDKLDLCT